MSRWAWIAIFWLVAGARGSAQTEPLPLELHWHAPAVCPTGDDVRAELERIARVRAGTTLRPLSADAQVVRRGAVFKVALQTEHEGRRGERHLEAADCKTLVRSVTLVLALAFGPAVELAADAASPPPPPPSAASAPLDPGAAPAPEAAPEPAPSDAGTTPLSLDLTFLLAAAATLNLFPHPAFAASPGFQLRWGPWALEARGLFWPRASTELASNIEARLYALGGSVSLCRLAALSSAFELTACAGARLAAISADTTGALAPGSATAPWTALAAATSVGWPRRSWLQLRLELALALSVSRPRFVVEAFGDAHRVPLLIPELGASALIRF